MKIIYFHQYFRTPGMEGGSPGGTRSYEFAKRLVERGHTVEMITAWPHKDGPTDGRVFTTVENGIHVHWICSRYDNRMRYARRVVAFAHFAIAAGLYAMRLNADVVFATSPPLTLALPAIYVSRRRRIPMVFEVRDLWPAAPIAVGALRSVLSIRIAKWLERTTYKFASRLIALSPAIRDGICRCGVPEHKITLIPNAADLDIFSPAIDGSSIRKEMDLTGSFVCVHLGAMGVVNGLDFVLDCARELQRRKIQDIVFLLHGHGCNRLLLEERCRSEGLWNVKFSGPSDRATAARVLASADVSLTLVKNTPALHDCSPNKFFDSLSAGKALIINVKGWLEQLTIEKQIGLFVEPDNVEHFAEQILFLRDHPEAREIFGRNARLLAEEQYSRDKLAEMFEGVFTTMYEDSAAKC